MVGYSSENGFALLIKKSIFLNSKKGKKHFRSPHLFASKKDDLLFWESPTIKKKPPYFKVHASCTASKSNEKYYSLCSYYWVLAKDAFLKNC